MLASACVRGASLEQGGCYRVTEERLYQALSSYAPRFPMQAAGLPRPVWGTSLLAFFQLRVAA
jgi:hypothetical protein